MNEIRDILANHPCLRGISQRHVDILAQSASLAEFGPKQFLMREGKEATECLLIQSGRVVVEVFVPGKGPVILQTLGPGDIVGWSWFEPPYRWKFDAWASEKITAIRLDGVFLRKRCEEDSEFGYYICKCLISVISGRLDATRYQLLDMYG